MTATLKMKPFFILLFACSVLFVSCGGGSSRDGGDAQLDRKIKVMLRDDNTITATEWDELSNASGELAGQDLYDYIVEIAATRRDDAGTPTIEADLPSSPKKEEVGDLEFSLFMESSGSMYPYTASSTDFKNAIYDLVTRISDKGEQKNLINYIGEIIFPVDESVRDFIGKSDPFDIAKKNKRKINTASTDINQIIKLLFEQGNKNAINILVSDCIYSIKGKDARDGLSKMKYITKDVFQDYSDDYSVLVLQLSSEYNGNYYPYDGSTVKYKGKRPYYMLFIGRNAQIEKMLNDKTYQEIQDFESLAGYENYHLFTQAEQSDLYYSVMPSTSKKGEFSADRDFSDRNYIRGLEDFELSSRDDNVHQFSVAVDLSDVLVEESYKTSPKNYIIDGVDDFFLESVEALDDYSKSDRRYIGDATHLLTISTEKITEKSQKLEIGLEKVLPYWIKKSATDDDRKMTSGSKLRYKTFGIDYMMDGIDEGYNPKGKTSTYFNISINLKK